MCWSIVGKEKQTVGSPFFGAFPSNCIRKATKVTNVNFFIHIFPNAAILVNYTANSCKLYHPNPGTFWSYYVLEEAAIEEKEVK